MLLNSELIKATNRLMFLNPSIIPFLAQSVCRYDEDEMIFSRGHVAEYATLHPLLPRVVR